MKKMRRILAAVVVICVLIGAIAWPDGAGKVWAEVSGDFEYDVLSDGTIKITKYNGSHEMLWIPGIIDGKYVTHIGDAAFAGNSALRMVSIADEVIAIGEDAFRDCSSLGDIDIPSGVSAIGGGAFYGCSSLSYVVIPAYVSRIGDSTFENCTGLGEVLLLGSMANIGARAFNNCTSLVNIHIPEGVDVIGSYAFGGCNRLRNVYYSGTEGQWNGIEIDPGSNAELLDAAIHCSGVSDPSKIYSWRNSGIEDKIEIIKYHGTGEVVEIPSEIDGKRVAYIGEGAFSGCKNLRKVSIPDSVEMVYRYAFYGCTGLTEISIPDSTFLGTSVFFDCTNLSKVNIPSSVPNVPRIGAYNFCHCRSLTEIVIPDNIREIGFRAFLGCESLAKLSISEGVTSIESEAFASCFGLTGITIPDSVTSIGNEAFHNCTGLTEIRIPSEVTSIGQGTFSGCDHLTDITVPKNVTSIGQGAFDGCSSLADVYYSGTEEEWDRIEIGLYNEALQKAKVHYGSGLPDDPAKDYDYTEQKDGTIVITKYKGEDEEVKIPAKINDKPVAQISEGAFMDNGSIKEVTVPLHVTEIAYKAFTWCPNLTAIYVDIGNESYASEDGVLFNKEMTELITYPRGKSGAYRIPSSVIKIGGHAFCYCGGLTGIDIPSSVASMGENAFFACSSLKEIDIPDAITSIGINAFCYCKELTKISIPYGVTAIAAGIFYDCTGLEEINIPDSVASIGSSAFYNCTGMEQISIPSSVASIGKNAFIKCSNLKDVYYSGTEKQWNKVEIVPDGNESLLNAAMHYKEEQPDPIPEEPGPEDPIPEEPVLPETVDAKQELAKLKAGDPFSLDQDFRHYLSEAQIDVIETCLYTWLAEINYAYKYSGSSGIRERIMKKAGIDPQGGFASGTEKAITHISVGTPYGPKTLEVTLDLGKPDNSGSLYPAYGTMRYEILEKGGIPSDIPTSGQIGKSSYTDMGTFIDCVSKASEDSLRSVHQWKYLSDGMAAGILVDKTVTEIIGIKNGFFFDGSYIVYVEPLFKYSKRVKVTGPVNIYVYRMDGGGAGSVVDGKADTGKLNGWPKAADGDGKENIGKLNARLGAADGDGRQNAWLMAADGDGKPTGADSNVRFDVKGNETTVYLTGNDYYLNLRGTGTGKLNYQVEEIANDDVQRSVQFLEMQLEKDMQYEGYVFRPLNIDRDLYALRTVGGSSQEVIYPSKDKQYQTLSLFKRVQGLSLSRQSTLLDANKTVQLDASLTPLDASNQNLQWTTDNGAVAKVDGSGLVTAVGSGRATVTVSTKDGSFLKQFCVIDVADRSSTGGTSGGSSFGSSGGWSGGGAAQSAEQQSPAVVNLHYVLQFNANGGTSLSRKTMTLLADDSPGIMPKAKRKGYMFKGWYTGQDGGTEVTGDKPLKEAVTLYAQWTKATAPAKVAAPTLQSKKKGQIRVSFKNVSGVAGYQVEYSTSKGFTSAKAKEAGASSKVKTLTGLKAGKKYYVRVRAYTVDSMKNRIYGPYSTVKSVKVKG